MKQYDIIVIGAGSGGLNIAGFMNKAGFSVLLIDKDDKAIGGDCLNYGCVPSKALIHVSNIVNSARESQKFGLHIDGKLNMEKVMQYVKEKQAIIRKHENAEYFRDIGMDVVLGIATFSGENEVTVNDERYQAKRIILATGSRPRKLQVPGIESVDYLTNENVFELKKLPKNLLIIGGGPIGIELGQAFSRLGSKVTIVQRESSFLPREHKDVSKVLYQKMKDEGIRFYFNSSPKEFVSKNEVVIENQDNKQTNITFDKILVSIGRVLNIEGLELEKAGIEVKDGKVVADEYLRTTNKNVFVCGDVAGSYQFTHAAELHAKVIINNFFSPIKKKVNYDAFSWVTYTSPEIATFGLHEDELKKRKVMYKRLVHDFTDDDRAIVEDFTEGKLILYVSEKNKILGGTMVGMNAAEIIQELVLAASKKINIKSIFNKIYAYPTSSRVNQSIVRKHFSGKLTGITKKIFKLLY